MGIKRMYLNNTTTFGQQFLFSGGNKPVEKLGREGWGEVFRPPGFTQGITDFSGAAIKVAQEFFVRATLAVVRFPGRVPKGFLHEAQVEMKKEGSVVKQEALLAFLGVSRKLPPTQGQVRETA
jgi:hypothetical protein